MRMPYAHRRGEGSYAPGFPAPPRAVWTRASGLGATPALFGGEPAACDWRPSGRANDIPAHGPTGGLNTGGNHHILLLEPALYSRRSQLSALGFQYHSNTTKK